MSDVRALVRRLGRGSKTQRAEAVRDLVQLAVRSPGRNAAIAAAGGIPALVRMLDNTEGLAQTVEVAAAAALAALAEGSSERSTAITVAGGIPALVRLLGRGNTGVRFCVTKALLCLARGIPERCAAISAANWHSGSGASARQQRRHSAGLRSKARACFG